MKRLSKITIFVFIALSEAYPFLDGEQNVDSQLTKNVLVAVDSKTSVHSTPNKTEFDIIQSYEVRKPDSELQGKDPKQVAATANPLLVVGVSAISAAAEKVIGAVTGVFKRINTLNSNYHLNAEAARLAPTTPTTTPKPTTPSTSTTTNSSSEVTDIDIDEDSRSGLKN